MRLKPMVMTYFFSRLATKFLASPLKTGDGLSTSSTSREAPYLELVGFDIMRSLVLVIYITVYGGGTSSYLLNKLSRRTS